MSVNNINRRVLDRHSFSELSVVVRIANPDLLPDKVKEEDPLVRGALERMDQTVQELAEQLTFGPKRNLIIWFQSLLVKFGLYSLDKHREDVLRRIESIVVAYLKSPEQQMTRRAQMGDEASLLEHSARMEKMLDRSHESGFPATLEIEGEEITVNERADAPVVLVGFLAAMLARGIPLTYDTVVVWRGPEMKMGDATLPRVALKTVFKKVIHPERQTLPNGRLVVLGEDIQEILAAERARRAREEDGSSQRSERESSPTPSLGTERTLSLGGSSPTASLPSPEVAVPFDAARFVTKLDETAVAELREMVQPDPITNAPQREALSALREVLEGSSIARAIEAQETRKAERRAAEEAAVKESFYPKAHKMTVNGGKQTFTFDSELALMGVFASLFAYSPAPSMNSLVSLDYKDVVIGQHPALKEAFTKVLEHRAVQAARLQNR
jgi:hypothetical protein